MPATEEVLLENERVKVTKVTIPPSTLHTHSEGRKDRVLIFLNNQITHRHWETQEHGAMLPERLQRDGHTAAYRKASNSHHIENRGVKPAETIIVELKG